MNRHLAIGSLAVVFVFTGLWASWGAGGADALVGDYAVEPQGQPEVRISRDGDGFVVSVRTRDGWSRPEKLVVCNEADYAQLFGPDWKQIEPVGLRATASPFGIFAVKKGASAQGHTFKTGYFMFLVSGGDIYKL